MNTDAAYELLRQLASPVVAITSNWRGRLNGMISDSAVRASISPRVPRLSVYIHKWHFSHELIWRSGRFTMHLLHQGQLELVHQLGFVSGRDQDKMTSIRHRPGAGGVPVLAECFAAFECQVINTMDTGYATHFLADVTATHKGSGSEILTASWLRQNLPAEWRDAFLANYRHAQEYIDGHAAIQDIRWSGPER
jgi:flavin reductase (DIM6/NTAB) family NADH-FMN oxidoreductase RutF